MNENEQARIADMAHSLRPDWPVASLRTLLARHELANKSRRDVAVALAWVACETETTTPARVIESGPWWRAANVETPDRTIRRPPQKAEECGVHEGEWAYSCRCCASDRKAARELAANGPRLTEDEARARIREAIEAARARHLSPPPTEIRDAIAEKPTTWPARAEHREPLERGDG